MKYLTGILSNLRKTKNNPLPKEGVEYQFNDVVVGDDSLSGVEVLDGPYKGVLYYYGRVKVLPPDSQVPDAPAVLSFDYRVHRIPMGLTKFDLGSAEFKQFAGDVLMSILLENEKGEYATIREHDSEEPHL